MNFSLRYCLAQGEVYIDFRITVHPLPAIGSIPDEGIDGIVHEVITRVRFELQGNSVFPPVKGPGKTGRLV